MRTPDESGSLNAHAFIRGTWADIHNFVVITITLSTVEVVMILIETCTETRCTKKFATTSALLRASAFEPRRSTGPAGTSGAGRCVGPGGFIRPADATRAQQPGTGCAGTSQPAPAQRRCSTVAPDHRPSTAGASGYAPGGVLAAGWHAAG